jgi:hypothetical protein
MPDETVIYRLEVMTIMTMIGDIRDELIRQVLDELLEIGWKELKEKAKAEGKPLRVEPPSRYA